MSDMSDDIVSKRKATVARRMTEAYLEALKRIVAEQPTHPDLKRLLKERGRIPITCECVALEARKSRDPLSRRRYPAVVEAIRAAAGKAPRETMPTMGERLREAGQDIDSRDDRIRHLETKLFQVSAKLHRVESLLRDERLNSQRADDCVTDFPAKPPGAS